MLEARTKLALPKIKEQWLIWSTGIRMELRAQKCLFTLKETAPSKIEDISNPELRDDCDLWLSEEQEEPETGWTTRKIVKNLPRYKKHLKKEILPFSNAIRMAMSIIYNNYGDSFKGLLGPHRDETAKAMWECLQKYCEIKGFASIDQAYTELHGFTYEASGSVGLYVGGIEEAKYTLTVLDQMFSSEF
jgi:hypothetical protein